MKFCRLGNGGLVNRCPSHTIFWQKKVKHNHLDVLNYRRYPTALRFGLIPPLTPLSQPFLKRGHVLYGETTLLFLFPSLSINNIAHNFFHHYTITTFFFALKGMQISMYYDLSPLHDLPFYTM
jgi:hypothetical protein